MTWIMKSLLEFSRFRKQMVAASVDLIFLPLTFFFAIWLRFDTLTVDVLKTYLWLIIAAPIVSIPIFIRLGLYRAVIRFIDQKIILIVISGVTLSVIVLISAAAFLSHMAGLSRGVFGIYWVSVITYVVAGRFLARSYFLHAEANKTVRVAIYGAGQAGIQLANAIKVASDRRLMAFIDGKKELQDATIAGVRIYAPEHLPELIAKLSISEILLAIPSLTKVQQKTILDHLSPMKVKIKVTPSIEKLVNGELRVQDVRDIDIEDLLGRDTVAPNTRLLAACIEGKSVMVTGAGGSIGSELCRQIIRLRPTRLILFEISEFALYSLNQELRGLNQAVEILPFLGSVLDFERCKQILCAYAVDTVYHAAAYKHVPLVEYNLIEGIRNNAFGTLKMAKAAIAAGVKNFVLISTDKAVRPTNVMGSTKRLAELTLQGLAQSGNITRFCMVRFGNVLGSSGSVVPLFRKQIMNGGPVTVTHPEITRYFMTINEAAQLVLQAGAMSEDGDVFVLDMGEPIKILDLAKRMIHLSGLELKSESAPNGIEIQIIGLRPGEKLYEELLIGNDIEGTEHPLIMRAHETAMPWKALQVLLKQLEDACNQQDCGNLQQFLRETVSGYVPTCEIHDLLWTTTHKKGGHQPVQPICPKSSSSIFRLTE